MQIVTEQLKKGDPLKEIIIELMRECAEITGTEIVSDLNDDTVLLETGLDSMGFATLVVRLDQELGMDPFTMTDDVIYPQTFGEFVRLYEDAKVS